MTFNAYETSIASGEPILLFDFALGIAHYRYCTADRNITYQANVYTAAPISRSAPVQSNDTRQQIMRVTCPRDIGVGQLFAIYPPAQDVLLTVTALHYNDPDQQGIVDWVGRVTAASWEKNDVIFSCEPVYTSVQTNGLRRRWGLNCPHVLYGVACTLNPSLFKVVAPIQSVSGFTITGAGFVPPSGLSFVGGYAEWDSGNGYLERRTIDAVSGTTLTLSYTSPQLVAGLQVSLYPGCNRTMANCNAFGNILNYGGQPNIPTQNPMDGSIANPVY